MKYFTLVCNLPKDEGTVLAETSSPLEEQFLHKHSIQSFVLRHGNYDFEKPYLGSCGGTFKVISVSEKKHVLVCDRCHLRIGLPRYAIAIRHLKKACEEAINQVCPSTV